MQILGFREIYSIYCIKCLTTNKYYIGSSTYVPGRIKHHICSFKSNKSTCTSKFVIENNNYQVSILKDNIMTKEEAKVAELNFINSYGDACVNVNKPMLISMKEYQKFYQKNYNEKKKLQAQTETSSNSDSTS